MKKYKYHRGFETPDSCLLVLELRFPWDAHGLGLVVTSISKKKSPSSGEGLHSCS